MCGNYVRAVVDADEMFQVLRVLPEPQDSRELLVLMDIQELSVGLGFPECRVLAAQPDRQEVEVHQEFLDLQATRVNAVNLSSSSSATSIPLPVAYPYDYHYVYCVA